MKYNVNPILDGYLLAGNNLCQLKPGFRWLPEKLIEEIELLEEVDVCKICNIAPEHGWKSHATLNHCENLEVQSDCLKSYRLCRGTSCLFCNITYGNEEERMGHIRIHLGQRLVSYYKMPIFKVGDLAAESIHEHAIKLKTHFHYNFYNQWNIRLYLMVPSWLNGDSVKEKLLNIDCPTYIPVSFAKYHNALFTTEIHRYYDCYSTLLYVPSLDEEFNGVRTFNRIYGKLMIRLLASLKQQPEELKNIRFILYKESKQPLFNAKYLVHVSDNDIKEVLQDVVTNNRTIICYKDLYDENGCSNALCMNFVHFGVNFSCIQQATHSLDRNKSLNRHDETRFGLGDFELINNPSFDSYMPFTAEVIRIKNFELEKRTPYFVYIVLCTKLINLNEMPTLENINDFTGGDEDYYSAYVGYSFRSGIPKSHFVDLLNNDLENPEDNIDEEDDNIDPEARLVGRTELTKAITRGNKILFMLRNYMEQSYEDAVKLEAAFQLYSKLSEENQIEIKLKVVNKRTEVSALSYLTVQQIEDILCLIDLKVPLLFDSPEAYETYLTNRNLVDVNWGIFQRPLFMTELQRLPL